MNILPIAAKIGFVALLAWAIISNLWSFILMGVDKSRAKKDKRRIPEKQLFLSAALGGAFGSMLGMRAFHHKTLNKSFKFGMPALLILNLAVCGLIVYLIIKLFTNI